MPTYRFLCADCGAFDVVRPMDRSTEAARCPCCGVSARRAFGAPGVRLLDPGLRRALDAGARSADEPAVVSAVPGRPRRATPITRDPRHRKLPRP